MGPDHGHRRLADSAVLDALPCAPVSAAQPNGTIVIALSVHDADTIRVLALDPTPELVTLDLQLRVLGRARLDLGPQPSGASRVADARRGVVAATIAVEAGAPSRRITVFDATSLAPRAHVDTHGPGAPAGARATALTPCDARTVRSALFALLFACHGPLPPAPAAHPLEPSAATVSAPLPPPPPPPLLEGAPAPAPRALDLSQAFDGDASFVGATSDRILVRLADTLLVVDRATRCVVETYPPSPVLHLLTRERAPAVVQLARPEVQNALRDLAGLLRMYHAHAIETFTEFVWNEEGTLFYVTLGNQLFRSADSGRTWQRLTAHVPNHLAMGGDGKHVVYDECTHADCNHGRRWVSLATDGFSPPVTLTHEEGHPLAMTADGRFVYARGAKTLCLDTFDLATAKKERSVCMPLPRGSRGHPYSEFTAVSPGLRYATVTREVARPSGQMAEIRGVVDLATSKLVSRYRGTWGAIDDAGNVVANEGDASFWIPLRGQSKPLAPTSLLVRLGDDVFVRGAPAPEPVPLAERRCDLLRNAVPPRGAEPHDHLPRRATRP